MTQSKLKSTLHYNENTGIFTRIHIPNARGINKNCIGKPAGMHDSHGHMQASIDGKKYLLHRLAWLYVHGHLPKDQIDHINGVRDDNRISNLRTVTHSVNQHNCKKRCDNTSGQTGVYWNKKASNWRVIIGNNKKPIHIGYYINKKDAIMARKEAEKKYGYHPNHGRITPCIP